MACNIAFMKLKPAIGLGFNPWRVFSWLATSTTRQIWTVSPEFQSLAGFFVACNRMQRPGRPCQRSFNPWRVFSWLATIWWSEKGETSSSVSIPGGFFRGLQLSPAGRRRLVCTVSIPGGFSRGLQHTYRIRSMQPYYAVSIPGGFFRGLQLCQHRLVSERGEPVSIPGGFFRGLQHQARKQTAAWYRSFNPWRVFSWLATMSPHLLGRIFAWFQSLAGFFVACNGTPELAISRYKAF